MIKWLQYPLKMRQLLSKWINFIDESFLPEPMKNECKILITKKAIQIELQKLACNK